MQLNKKIGISLSRLSRFYRINIHNIQNKDGSQFEYFKERSKWFKESNIEFANAKYLYGEAFNKPDFENEVSNATISSDTNYFDYLHNGFTNYFNFLKKEMNFELSEYIDNSVQGYNEASLLGTWHGEKTLSKEQFIRAIKMDLILNFDLLEGIYSSFNPKYSRLLLINNTFRDPKNQYYIPIHKHINKFKLINILYNRLIHHGYILISQDEFNKHFNVSNFSGNRIAWLKYNNSLYYLFIQLDKHKLIDSFISIDKVIIQHFLNKESKELKIKTVRTKVFEIKHFQNPYDKKIIDEIIDEIMEQKI